MAKNVTDTISLYSLCIRSINSCDLHGHNKELFPNKNLEIYNEIL